MRLKNFLSFIFVLFLASCSPSDSVYHIGCNVGELITAIENANADPDHSTIHLEAGCIYELTALYSGPGTIGMAQVTGLPPISTTIIIKGHNATIQRQVGSPDFRIFYVTPSGGLGLHDLSILNGSVINGVYNFDGGGIYVDGGILTLLNSHMENNTAESNGGGIYNYGGIANIDTSTIISNHAEDGGGIFNYVGTVIISNSSAVNNNTATVSGGGISSFNGEVTIGNSQVNNNEAVSNGGGLYMIKVTSGTPDLTISGALFDGNIANDKGGAIYMEETTFSIMSSTFTNNQASGTPFNIALSTKGGAIYIQDSKPGTIGFGSLFDTNSTDGGGGAIGIFNYSSGDLITIRDTTIQNNTAGTRGGGIDNNKGDMSIIDSTITGNTGPDTGGGVSHSQGELLIQDSTISNNTASVSGGGVFVFSSILTMTGSTLQGNQAVKGGGLYTYPSNNITSIDNTVFEDNTAQREGGGIYNNANCVMTLDNSTVSNNQAMAVDEGYGGGGIFNRAQGIITISNTTISGNISNLSGGGVVNIGDMWIYQSVIHNNTAPSYGGGISTMGTLTMLNSTVSGNQSGDSGGGVSISGSSQNTVIVSSSIVHNTAVSSPGGLVASNATSMFKNIIVAMNTPSDCSGIPGASAVGNNLDSDGTCTGFTITADPLIGPLADNGGPTWTHALLPGSPALDVATDCTDHTGTPLTFDQRFASRPGGPECDLGAYEDSTIFVPPPPPMIIITPTQPVYWCKDILGITILEGGMMRIQVETSGLPDGIYTATVGKYEFTCKTYPEYPDRLFCDGPKGEGGTLTTLTIFDPLGLPFCEETFSIPARDVPDIPDEPEGCNSGLSQTACTAAGGKWNIVSNLCACP